MVIKAEKKRANFQQRYYANLDKERLRAKIYKHANPDKVDRINGIRAERIIQQSDGSLTRKVVAQLFAQATSCPYCKDDFSRSRKSLDHVQPIALGGAHGIENVLICCWNCNRRKRAMPFTEWMDSAQVHELQYLSCQNRPKAKLRIIVRRSLIGSESRARPG